MKNIKLTVSITVNRFDRNTERNKYRFDIVAKRVVLNSSTIKNILNMHLYHTFNSLLIKNIEFKIQT